MSDLLEQFTVLNSPELKKRVCMGMYVVAREILLDESEEDEIRKSYAQIVLQSPIDTFDSLVTLIVTDPAIDTNQSQREIADEQILASIRKMWNILSGKDRYVPTNNMPEPIAPSVITEPASPMPIPTAAIETFVPAPVPPTTDVGEEIVTD